MCNLALYIDEENEERVRAMNAIMEILERPDSPPSSSWRWKTKSFVIIERRDA
ncbi:MAG: hypothetical protein QGH21_06355 [Candidatus Poseidoniia archaeon]|nr:hypothetical protein [Candidatus Poseidoniia archaeon]